eukprot:5476187-Prymnesium_polylepis.1
MRRGSRMRRPRGSMNAPRCERMRGVPAGCLVSTIREGACRRFEPASGFSAAAAWASREHVGRQGVQGFAAGVEGERQCCAEER